MARNGSGSYSLPAGNPVVTGTTISSTVHNNTMTDIATALTASLAKDGQTVLTGALDFNGVELILDADGDTTFHASTDDQIDIRVAGADDFTITANALTALSGSAILTDTISETTAANGVVIDGVTLKDGGINATTASTITADLSVTSGSFVVGSATVVSGYDAAVVGAGSTEVLIGSTDGNGVTLVLDGNSNGDGSGGDYAYIQHDSTGLEFSTGSGTIFTMNASTATVNQRLDVISAQSSKIVLFQNTHATVPNGVDLDFSAASPNNTAQWFLSCQDQTTTRMLVWSNGDIINVNNSYGAISDRKLKQDLTPANSQTADIKAISGIACNFKFIADVDERGEDAVRHLGVIAQDLELISPGLVKATADRDVDGELTGGETLSVNYSVMYMKAVVALGEALEMIDDLKLRVAALEAV